MCSFRWRVICPRRSPSASLRARCTTAFARAVAGALHVEARACEKERRARASFCQNCVGRRAGVLCTAPTPPSSQPEPRPRGRDASACGRDAALPKQRGLLSRERERERGRFRSPLRGVRSRRVRRARERSRRSQARRGLLGLGCARRGQARGVRSRGGDGDHLEERREKTVARSLQECARRAAALFLASRRSETPLLEREKGSPRQTRRRSSLAGVERRRGVRARGRRVSRPRTKRARIVPRDKVA